MPRLETQRLILRPPEYSDAAAIATLASDYQVAKNLLTMPHPFSEADARNFVSATAKARALCEGFVFAIHRKPNKAMVGQMLIGIGGLHLKNGTFELGYWLGQPFWGQGYASEAARALAAFAIGGLKCDALTAGYFPDNPASGRVLEKLGFVATHREMLQSRARGRAVECVRMALTKENFGRKKAA